MTRYFVPDKCIRCAAAGSVEVVARTPNGGVALFWHCRCCHNAWPIQPEEQAGERRNGRPDRRRHTRADRRKRSDK